MKKLKIGDVIYKLRKDKGITQEQLAEFVGVSTAAVSKWESGASYPDITLLPVLATFFNVTIDELLNFNIELSEEEVNKIYGECVESFNNDEFQVAIEKGKGYVNKFPNSYPLKFRMASLIFGSSWMVETQEKLDEIIDYVIKINEDIVANCGDIKLVEPSLFCLGSLYSSNGEDDKAIEVLNKIHKSQCDPNDILAGVYLNQNKVKEGRNLLQGKIFKAVSDIGLSCMSLANSYIKFEKDFYTAEKYHNLAIDCKKLVTSGGLDVLSLWLEYFLIAESYLLEGKKEKAMESLNLMIEFLKKYPVDIYSKINSVWCLSEVDISKEKNQTLNIYENIFKMFENEHFDSIRESKEFKIIIEDIKLLEKNYKINTQ